MKKKIMAAIGALTMFFICHSALAEGVIPDHRGTSMEGIDIGTASVGVLVREYDGLFKMAGDRYGVDPNLLEAICMQESGGVNYHLHADGTEYPAWGIMQIEYSLVDTFSEFGEKTTGEKWTSEDRLVPEKAIPFAAHLISKALIRYDCDYMKMIQSYNFGQTVLDRIIEAKGDDWLSERANAAAYATDWPYDTYGDKEYIEHVLMYYHDTISYNGAKVRFNGKLIDFDDQFPLLETVNNKTYTMIPIRAVSELLGAEVKWDDKTKAATIKKDGHKLVLYADKDSATVDGEIVTLDMPAMIINSRTMVPLRFIMESFDLDVDWDGDSRTVLITK